MSFIGLPFINKKQKSAKQIAREISGLDVQELVDSFVFLEDSDQKLTRRQREESERQLIDTINSAKKEDASLKVRNLFLVGNGLALFAIAGVTGVVFAASASFALEYAKEIEVPHLEQITGTVASGITLTNLALLANFVPIISPIVNLGTAILISPVAFACAKQALIKANEAIDSEIKEIGNSPKISVITAFSTKTLLRLVQYCVILPAGELAKFCQDLLSTIPETIGTMMLKAFPENPNIEGYKQIASFQDRIREERKNLASYHINR